MISKNILWNLAGSVLPLLVGVILFPKLIHAYGLERFGLVAISWSLVGYFSLFDMGLSRALTQVVSEKLQIKESSVAVSKLIYSAFSIMWLLGIIGGACLWLSADWLISSGLKLSPELKPEAIITISIIAVSIPFVVHTSGLKGVMDALHLFKQSSIIKMIMGVGTFLGPYIASLYSDSLEYAAYSLVMIRMLIWLMHWLVVKKQALLLNASHSISFSLLKPLFIFGGWMTVSNVIGPLMVYLDRFVIAAMIGTISVTYYVAPYEVITKLWVVPAAISGVLFPLFAQHWINRPEHAAAIMNKGIAYTLMLLFPVTLVIAISAKLWLAWWLGKSFSVQSASIVYWLSAGVLINSIAQILYAKVQGAGKAEWTAKLHLLESIPYWLILWLLLKFDSIEGAAIAWFLRATVDFIGLAYLAKCIHNHNNPSLNKLIFISLLSCIPILCLVYTKNLTVIITILTITSFVYFALAIKKLKHDGYWQKKIVL